MRPSLRSRLAPILTWASKARAELLTTAAIVGGWACLTWGIASLLVPQVWLISAGLALLSAAGWRFLAEIVWAGIYVLMRREAGRG